MLSQNLISYIHYPYISEGEVENLSRKPKLLLPKSVEYLTQYLIQNFQETKYDVPRLNDRAYRRNKEYWKTPLKWKFRRLTQNIRIDFFYLFFLSSTQVTSRKKTEKKRSPSCVWISTLWETFYAICWEWKWLTSNLSYSIY